MKTGNLEVRTGAMVREVLVGADGLATRRFLRRQEDAQRSHGQRASRRAGRELLRDGAHHAELQEQPVPERHRQLHGPGRQVHHGYGGLSGERLPADSRGPAAGRMKTASAACTCTCPGGSTRNRKPARCRSRADITSKSAAAAACRAPASLGGSHNLLGGGYGEDLKRDLRKIYGADVHFAGRGEMIPNEDSYCEIDPNVVDQWGIPVLRFHFKWSQDEILQAKHMQETFQEIIETAGGMVTQQCRATDRDWGISRGGEIIHEVGATKMGDDPKTSVLNQ